MQACQRSPVGASLLAKNLRAPRGFRHPVSSLTTIVGTPPGACSRLQCSPHSDRGGKKIKRQSEVSRSGAVRTSLCRSRLAGEGGLIADQPLTAVPNQMYE